MPAPLPISRRGFLQSSAASCGALVAATTFAQNDLASGTSQNQSGLRRPVNAFVKYVQSLSFDQLAETIAGMGFDGIEATIRRGGQIEPDQAPDQLGELVEALRRQNLQIGLMATNIQRADDQVSEELLRTAASLGVPAYRMQWYRYDLNRPIKPQLKELQRQARDVAAMNRELGITGLYQNHAGPAYVGASVWDLVELLDGIPPAEIGAAFDIRHATIEGGLAWPVSWKIVQPHLGAVFVKDARWDGRNLSDVPLGEGVVNPRFFKMLNDSEFSGPISLHVEYLEDGDVEENLNALKTDYTTLKGWLSS